MFIDIGKHHTINKVVALWVANDHGLIRPEPNSVWVFTYFLACLVCPHLFHWYESGLPDGMLHLSSQASLCGFFYLLKKCIYVPAVCLITAEKRARSPSQCGAPHPAESSSLSSAPLSSPTPPRLQCSPWWCCERQLAGWWVNRSHLDNAIICVGGPASEKNIPLNSEWHSQMDGLTLIAVV